MGFHLCFPVNMTARAGTKPRPVDEELVTIIQQHFVLDSLLLDRAEVLFDKLVNEMARKKRRGMLCDLSAVLKHSQTEFGVKCV